MNDADCVQFLQWALPQLQMRWPGFRKVRRQVCRRIDRRWRELGLENLTDYRDFLHRHADEWSALDELCRISISRFHRDRRVFELLRDEMLPQLAAAAIHRGDHVLRVWSAGCASGEEPYTLKIVWKMAVAAHFPMLHLQITATDADPVLLARAQRGYYPVSSLKDLPAEWTIAAFSRSDDEFCLHPGFRAGIEFRLQDVRREQPAGPFDVVLCRHLVFTYFDTAMQMDVLDEILRRLLPNGLLVIGKQEELPPSARQLELAAPHSGIYRQAAEIIRRRADPRIDIGREPPA